MTKLNAKETAIKLIQEKFPVSKYRELHAERQRRYEFFKEKRLTPLIYDSALLLKFSRKVLRILEENEIMMILKNHKFNSDIAR